MLCPTYPTGAIIGDDGPLPGDEFRRSAADALQGQDGVDTLLFNGSGANETIDISANGTHAMLFRNVGAITMDTQRVETMDVHALGGTDTVTVMTSPAPT